MADSAEPSIPEGIPSREEILQRLQTLEQAAGSIARDAAAIDADHLRADLEALAVDLRGIRALIHPPNDLPPALHRVRLFRFSPMRRLLLWAFEMLLRRQMLINEQVVAALEVEHRLIRRIGQALSRPR